MPRLRRLTIPMSAGVAALTALAVASPAAASAAASAHSAATSHVRNGAIQYMAPFHRHRAHGASSTAPLAYNGGTSDGSAGLVGVETAPKVYLVLWGSQWSTSGDPSGEANLVESFLGNVGGSNWNGIVTQYCQGVATGSISCNGAGTPAGNPSHVFGGVWNDTSRLPKHISQSSLASEAVAAAAHFGNTTTASNASVQYVIATPTGHNAQGFGSQYCAYHSSASSSYGDVAYTNLPYITDAGASCGANFNGLGADAGITIVEGHEFAETETDQFPNGGWLDNSGSEIGDKCAWNAATSDQNIGGTSYPVQPLWSNAVSGCALS